MTFYRLYRPQNFAELQEQEHIRTTLENALKKDKVASAYVFAGPRGTGKTTTARVLSKAIICTDRSAAEPCGVCEFCRGVEQGIEMDVVELDAASHTGVDDIRDLIEKSRFAPVKASKKIYIIDEVHMLSRSAFNALLKTLEEPDDHLHFILCTTEIEKIPETVLSRCQRFDFHRITSAGIVEKLKKIATREEIEIDSESLAIIADQSEGGLRNAEVLLEQLSSELEKKLDQQTVSKNLGLAEEYEVGEFLDLIQDRKLPEIFQKLSTLEEDGINFKEFIKKILVRLRDRLLDPTSSDDQLDRTIKLVKIFRKAGAEMKSTIVPSLPLEIAAVKSIGSSESKKKPKKSEARTPVIERGAEGADEDKLRTHPDLPSAVRNVLKGATIKSQDSKLIIELGSQFFLELLTRAENALILERITKEIFASDQSVECVLVEKITSELPDSFSPPVTSSQITKKKSAAEIAALIDGE